MLLISQRNTGRVGSVRMRWKFATVGVSGIQRIGQRIVCDSGVNACENM